MVEKLPSDYWMTPNLAHNSYTKVVQKTSGQAVLDIPAENYFFTTTYAMLPYVYNKKILGGYFNYLADSTQSQAFLNKPELRRFLCDPKFNMDQLDAQNIQHLMNTSKSLNEKLIDTLKKNDIRTLVIHKNDPIDHAKYYFPECANVRIQSSILLPQLFVADSTEKQKILSLFFPAIPSIGDTIIMPEEGTFYLDGIHAYPIDWLPLHIYLDGKEINIMQEWDDKGNNNATIDPFLVLKVQKNSKLLFQFENSQKKDYSFVKIWYRYQSLTNVPMETYQSDYPIAKIFEDDDAAVFILK